MIPPELPAPSGQILVAVDASRHSQTALAVAVRLAKRLGAPLRVLFVEDLDLLHVASLPFARQVDVSTGTCRAFDPRTAERLLAAERRRVQVLLDEALRQVPVPFSFDVVRGKVQAELLAAAGQAEFVFVGKTGWRRHRRAHLGRKARALLVQAHRTVFLCQSPAPERGPLLVLNDGSPAATRAVRLATQLLTEDQKLVVALATGDAQRSEVMEATRAELSRRGIEPDFHVLRQSNLSSLLHLARRIGVGGVLLPGGTEFATDAAIDQLVAELDCPVGVVR